MGFLDPILEQQRIDAAALLNMKLEPRTSGDLAVVILLSVVYGIDLLAALALLWNRKYPPIKSKGPILMACLFVCSALWFVGDLQVNGHVRLINTVFTNCRGFGFWVRALMGICGVCAIVALRSYALHRVFKLNLSNRGFCFYLPLLVYIGCILVYGIVAMALHASASVEYMPLLDICRMDEPFKITIFVFIWVTAIFVGFINWKIRNIKSSFNESREMAIACGIVFVVLTFNTCVQFIHPHYPFVQRYRITTTILDHVCANALWWSVIAKPLYCSLFIRKRYLRKWVRRLRNDGLQRAYEIESTDGTVTGGSRCNEDSTIISSLGHKKTQQEFFYTNTPSTGNRQYKNDDTFYSVNTVALPPVALSARRGYINNSPASSANMTLAIDLMDVDPSSELRSPYSLHKASWHLPTLSDDFYWRGTDDDSHIL
ncbi:hypothetical protein COEREDRAFT_90090 [Coemansia reversa NRRL 1564]|uniref:G-protein coupled receptors family 3 profile domain-containing protein n=1 Tax=Coemansia reversa (strain ATCC 12441 / NRRL 1564) TaxID=763665 RepID=A0A2G5B140_COERN|nr:hypothetical protein COEREDRAFT_90090 [Coemansia reversa NRRL 1564]|eukprot:PIA12735.1 hypothetical protein COEREDRAFT_90090 [Coemansia reversa NRRL 1564]